MASFNRVILVGNLTRDPEMRYSGSGMAIAKLGLAVNDRRKTPSGEWVDEATFVDITLFGRQAEIASEYLTKGASCLIEGRLKLDSWEGQDGQKRSKLVVNGDNVRLLGGRGEGGGGPRNYEGGGAPRNQGTRSAPAANSNYGEPHEEFDAPPSAPFSPPDNDIPF